MRITEQEHSRLRVLKAVQRFEPIARTQLAHQTGLAGGTITEVIADLVRRDILIEERAAAGGRGRPRVYLRINPSAVYVAGAYLFADGSLSVEIVNMRGVAIFERVRPLPRPATIEELAANVADLIDLALVESEIPRGAISQVGVALPALIDSVAGVIHWLQTFPIAPTPAAAIIEQRLGLPVTIDNTANVSARAEHWFGDHETYDDFSLFTNGLSIGSARYLDGILWAGANGLNREIGHVKVVFEGGLPCGCGARGCLAGYVSIAGVVAQICAARGVAFPPMNDTDLHLADFAAAARNGDRDAAEIFAQAGKILGTVVANHINESDPGRVLVLNFNAALRDMTEAPFRAAIAANVLPTMLARTTIDFALAREDWFRKGAAALALEHLYLRPAAKEH